MNIRVECYAGYRGEETPRAFYLGEQRVEVKEVLDRWLAPDYRYFKVQANDNSIYILRHETQSNDWTLTLFQAPGGWAQGQSAPGRNRKIDFIQVKHFLS